MKILDKLFGNLVYLKSNRIIHNNKLLSNILEGKILWTNPNPNNDFNAQTVPLSDNINNFKSYIVIYKYYKTDEYYLQINMPTTFLKAKMLGLIDYLTERRIDFNGTQATFGNGYRVSSFGAAWNGTVDNTRNIPVQIIGHI